MAVATVQSNPETTQSSAKRGTRLVSLDLLRGLTIAGMILVNNAGSAPGGVLEFLTEEHWAQSLQLKFMGYVRCLKHVLPIMQKQGRGRVVNLIGNDGVKPSYWDIAPGAANAARQN